jgi:flagellar biosynthesis/type III secretory pathway protein FliH
LSRVLRRPILAHHARRLEAPEPRALPEEVRVLIEREVEAAYERGRAEGRREGRELAQAELETLDASIRRAIEAGLARLSAWREAEAARTVELALALARHVVDRESLTGAEVAERVRRALAAIDDGPLEVAVHPDQVEAVAAALAGEPVTVRPEAALALGEARVEGPWASAELTFEAAFEVLREALMQPSAEQAPPPA